MTVIGISVKIVPTASAANQQFSQQVAGYSAVLLTLPAAATVAVWFWQYLL